MKKIIMSIDPKTGGVSVKTEGYQGEECLKATAGLESGLGMRGQCELSPEYYEKAEQRERVGGEGEATT